MMHEHDTELIAAIAAGDMSREEQAAAEASLASCKVCRTDLQLQREALEALAAAPPVMMNDLERAAVRRQVWTAVTSDATRPDSLPRAPWFQRWIPAMAAAAALLVVVGVGSVLVGDSAETDLAVEATTAPTENLRATADEEMAEAPSAGALDDVAEAAPTPMAALDSPGSVVVEYGSISSEGLQDVALSLGASLEAAEADGYVSPSDLQSPSPEPALACAEVALENGPISAIGRASVEGDGVEIYRINDSVYVYAAVDCSLSATFE